MMNLLDPWKAMDRWQREMTEWARGLEGGVRRTLQSSPPVNVWRTDEAIHFEFLTPGFSEGQLDVTLEQDRLTVSGERPATEVEEGERVLRDEQNALSFKRQFQLPFAPERDAVDAHYAHGVLTVTLPRPAEERPRRIELRTS